jgi:signal transduction histidine kinase
MGSTSVRWMLVVAIGLVAGFVASTIYIVHKVATIETHVTRIVTVATPSIGALAGARTDERQLFRAFTRAVDGDAEGLDRAAVAEARGALDERLADQHPVLAGEQTLYDEILQTKRDLYRLVDQAQAAIAGQRRGEARSLVLGPMASTLDRFDDQLVGLIRLYASSANAHGRTIDVIRRRTALVALALDGFTILLGGVMLLLALRGMRLYERLMAERERAASARAEELDRCAARVAHDLKGPLTSVVRGVSTAQAHPAQAPELLGRAMRSARIMTSMIDALLEFARAGAAPSQKEATLVKPIVDELVAEVAGAAKEAAAAVRVEPVSPALAVACRPGALASVLSNLLQNAIKYIVESQGERTVTVRAEARDEVVHLEVEDTGPGVSEDMQSSVFEIYVRAKAATAKPGLGLGLAPVKRLVEAHGGRLGVRSRGGCGACFWVELARAPAPATPTTLVTGSASLA